jgi:hypothetical protein
LFFLLVLCNKLIKYRFFAGKVAKTGMLISYG